MIWTCMLCDTTPCQCYFDEEDFSILNNQNGYVEDDWNFISFLVYLGLILGLIQLNIWLAS